MVYVLRQLLIALGRPNAEIVEVFESGVSLELGDGDDGSFVGRGSIGRDDFVLLGGECGDEEGFLV